MTKLKKCMSISIESIFSSLNQGFVMALTFVFFTLPISGTIFFVEVYPNLKIKQTTKLLKFMDSVAPENPFILIGAIENSIPDHNLWSNLTDRSNNSKTKHYDTSFILHTLVKSRSTDLINKFITTIDLVNIVDGDGNRPLHFLKELYDEQYLLLAVPALQNQEYHSEEIFNHDTIASEISACKSVLGKPETVVQSPNIFCRLMKEISRSSRIIAENLINAGEDVNARNNEGNTLLHIASAQNHYQIAEKLVRNGADKNIKNHLGLTPEKLAFQNQNFAIYNLLSNFNQ
jgi:ankyrin repeat protein